MFDFDDIHIPQELKRGSESLDVGNTHVLIAKDGELFCMGLNDFGQCDIPYAFKYEYFNPNHYVSDNIDIQYKNINEDETEDQFGSFN